MIRSSQFVNEIVDKINYDKHVIENPFNDFVKKENNIIRFENVEDGNIKYKVKKQITTVNCDDYLKNEETKHKNRQNSMIDSEYG